MSNMHHGQIWWDIFKETTRNTNRDLVLEKVWARPMIAVLIYAIYVLLVWSKISAVEASAQLEERLLWLLAPLVLYPPWWLVRLLRTIPEREQRSVARITRLRYFLSPRLEFQASDSGCASRFLRGHVQTSVAGTKMSVSTGYNDIICGLVVNPTRKDVGNVQVKIVELVGTNGSRLVDPVICGWREVNQTAVFAEIPATGARTIKLFRTAHEHTYFEAEGLPIEYVHFFHEGGTFTGKLSITDGLHVASIVHFVLEVEPENVQFKVVHVASAEPQDSRDIETKLQETANGQLA
jgi:hypothetical protein